MKWLIYLAYIGITAKFAIAKNLPNVKQCPKGSSNRRSTSLTGGNYTEIYTWGPGGYVSLADSTRHKRRGYDKGALRGRTLRVLVSEIYPYIYVDAATGRASGFVGEFWMDVQAMLGFKSEFIVENDYDVAMELMVDGVADVFLSSIVPRDRLTGTITYSQPYLYNWYLVGFKEVDGAVGSSFYLHIYSKPLLGVALVVYVTLALVLWVAMRILGRVHQVPHVSFPSCVIVVFGGFLNQASDPPVKYASIRLIIVASLVFGYLLYTAFNAMLVSQLTNAGSLPPVKTLDDVAEQRTHALCVRNSSFVYNYFLGDDGGLMKKWRGLVNEPSCNGVDVEHDLERILCKEDAIVLEHRVKLAAAFNQHESACNVRFLDAHYFEGYNYIAYRKQFDERILISRSINQLRGSGVMRHLDNKWLRFQRDPKRAAAPFATPAVSLHHVSGILIMLLVMVALSVAILVSEIVCASCKRGRMSSKKAWTCCYRK